MLVAFCELPSVAPSVVCFMHFLLVFYYFMCCWWQSCWLNRSLDVLHRLHLELQKGNAYVRCYCTSSSCSFGLTVTSACMSLAGKHRLRMLQKRPLYRLYKSWLFYWLRSLIPLICWHYNTFTYVLSPQRDDSLTCSAKAVLLVTNEKVLFAGQGGVREWGCWYFLHQ